MTIQPYKILKTIGILILIIIITLWVIEIFSRWNESDKKLTIKFEKWSDNVTVHMTQNNAFPIRYFTLGDKNSKPLLLIHGAPGSIGTWSAFIESLEEQGKINDWYIIIPDRPGYGYSKYGFSTQAFPSVEWQAALLEGVTKEIVQPITMITHSYGGPIGMILANNNHELFEKHIAIGAVADPVSEPVFFISHIIKYPPFSRILTPSIMTSNKEKLAHKNELRNISEERKNVVTPTTILHGKKDRIAPVESAWYMEARIPKPYSKMNIYEQGDHFIPFSKTEYIIQALYAD